MKLEDLEALLSAATPGPWTVQKQDGWEPWWSVTNDPGSEPWEARVFDDGSACGEYSAKCTPATRDAIVALMNAAPALLRVAKAARAWRDCEYAPPAVHDGPRFYGNAREVFDELNAAVEALEVDDG